MSSERYLYEVQMIIVVEKKDLTQNIRADIISRFGESSIFCSPKDITSISLRVALFIDIYYEALSYCLIHDIEIRFLYGDKVLSQGDITYIDSLQADLLKK